MGTDTKKKEYFFYIYLFIFTIFSIYNFAKILDFYPCNRCNPWFLPLQTSQGWKRLFE